jgi:2-iminobutanoate/2-iminopropanoate deaminase
MRFAQSCVLFASLLVVGSAYGEKKAVTPTTPAPNAPAPLFSPGILADGTLYVAGQLGTVAGQVPDKFEDEVKAALDNVGAILKAGGMTYSDVVSVTVYLTDMDLFQQMNGVYTTVFSAPRPARTAVGVSRLGNAKAHLEITVTARK